LETVQYGAYYRDEVLGMQTNFTLRMPDGNPWVTWSHTAPATYQASWWFWTWILPAEPILGTWHFEAEFNGQSYSHPFIVMGADPVVPVKIFLEGPYQPGTDNMSTSLASALPLEQPFDSTIYSGTMLEYHGSESVVSIPGAIVDWVLVQLRGGDPFSPPMDVISTRAAFVKADGMVVDLDGTSPVTFPYVPHDTYYVAVFHRNHLGVMSSSQVSISDATVLYDFTDASTKAYGVGPMKEVEPGTWGLFSGDANTDGFVTAPDFNMWNAGTTAGATGYEQADCNMDGNVTAPDFNLWNANTTAGAASQVPD
jgi:hypothetical protein